MCGDSQASGFPPTPLDPTSHITTCFQIPKLLCPPMPPRSGKKKRNTHSQLFAVPTPNLTSKEGALTFVPKLGLLKVSYGFFSLCLRRCGCLLWKMLLPSKYLLSLLVDAAGSLQRKYPRPVSLLHGYSTPKGPNCSPFSPAQ